jgi:glyoxylase-like metal-dependent hydrolase (beta-lactamase superfamily II)
MTELTRRTVLAGAAVASAATALTPLAPAKAAAPLLGTQAPGWYRYKVGSYEITCVTDGRNTFKFPDNFVLNAKKDQVNEALAASYMEKDTMTIPYTPIVVNTGSKLVAFDTGTGEGNFERSKGVGGQYHGNLKAAGIDRNAIDVVIISHFHGDHINGLITPDKRRSRMPRSWCRRRNGNTLWMTGK